MYVVQICSFYQRDNVLLSRLLIPGTNSAAGLNTTTALIQQQGRHDDGVPVVVIFLTDGQSNNKPSTEMAARHLHTTLPQVSVTVSKLVRICEPRWKKNRYGPLGEYFILEPTR